MLLYNYVGIPNNNILCCICRAPFTDPVTTTTCQHTFCRDCITRALSHAAHCPVDRLPLSEGDLGPVNPIVRSLVDELLVECVYKDEGCEAKVQRQCLAIHLKEECVYSESGISKSISVTEEVANEEKGKSSQVNDGDEVVKASTLSDEKYHGDASTSGRPSTANALPSRSKRISHLTEQNVLLRHRLDTMEGAVQMLKKEMAAVRTVLNPWVHNAASSSAAGASRVPVPQNRNGGLGINAMPPVVEQAQAWRTSPGTNSRGNNTGAEAQSNDSTLEDADLASYFPAEDEVRVRRPPAQPHPQQSQQSLPEYMHTQRQRPPGMGHMHHHSLSSLGGDAPLPFGALSMGYFGSPHTAVSPLSFYGSNSVLSPPTGAQYSQLATQPISVPIPELDLSSPALATTLHGLHSSVASLASTIEDIHKKSDLALALMGGGAGAALPGGGVVGEVLRLGEEVMGVRATVQGLRVQMHGLMMGNVGVGAGMNMGFRPQASMNSSGNGASANGEEGAADGHCGFPAQGGLQNQRMFYPGAALGITKL